MSLLGSIGTGLAIAGGSALMGKLFGNSGGSGGSTDPRFWERYQELSQKAEAILDANQPIMVNGFPVYPRGPQRQAAAYMGLAPNPGGGYVAPSTMDTMLTNFGGQFGGLMGKGVAGGIANKLFPQATANPTGTQAVNDLLVMPDVDNLVKAGWIN